MDPLFPLHPRDVDDHCVLGLNREIARSLYELTKRSWPVTIDSFHTIEGFSHYITSPQVALFHVADGVIMVDSIQTGLSARVHPLFDRGGRVTRAHRVLATKRFAAWLFDALDVHRLYGETPEVQPHLRAMTLFARAIGFKHEGVLRDAIYFNGSFHNVHVNGLLDTDLEAYNGRRLKLVKAEDAQRPDPGPAT